MTNQLNLIVVAMTEARAAIKGKDNLQDRLRTAMKVTKGHWLVTNEDDRFRAAVAATLMESDREDKERIIEEMKALNTLGALFGGLAIDFSKVEFPKNPIGLMGIWMEVQEEG